MSWLIIHVVSCMSAPPCLSASFTNVNNFCHSLFASLTKFIQIGAFAGRKENGLYLSDYFCTYLCRIMLLAVIL